MDSGHLRVLSEVEMKSTQRGGGDTEQRDTDPCGWKWLYRVENGVKCWKIIAPDFQAYFVTC